MKTYKRKTKKVVCENCEIEFEKSVSEINRTNKRNGNHYCSIKCNGQNTKKNLGENLGKGNVKHFHGDGRRDEFTGFREFLRRARNRKNLGDLTLIDLKKQWEIQKEICPYSGIKMKLPVTRRNEKNLASNLASLDRIDSTKIYEKGNIQFVITPINYLKNNMSHDDTVNICKAISKYWLEKENMGTNKT